MVFGSRGPLGLTIAGPPAARDTAPTALVAWRAYVDHRGAARPLPPGVLVTSRAHGSAGKAKPRHYALFCSTSEPLRVREHGVVDITELRNLTSRNAVASSQTTAIVERAHPRALGRAYTVAVIADLIAPYHVTLTDPVPITADALAALQTYADDEDEIGWTTAVRETLGASRSAQTRSHRSSSSMPRMTQDEHAASRSFAVSALRRTAASATRPTSPRAHARW